MNAPRDPLDPRFRGTLLARVENVRALFDALELMSADEEARRQVLAELHTLKGESRMLGLSALADLIHLFEDEVSRGSEARFPLLVSTSEILRTALSSSAGPEQRAKLIAAALSKFGAYEPDASAALSGRPPAADAIPPLEQLPDSAPSPEVGPARTQERWVQVDSLRVDEVCEALGELSLQFGRLKALLMDDASERHDSLKALDVMDSVSGCRALLDDCTLRAWTLRLVPLSPMLKELAAHAQRLARQRGKPLNVVTVAEGVQLERNVVEQMWDSLLHLVQNSIDHGLEEAGQRTAKPAQPTLRISARSRGPNVTIRVEDDGRGIDPNLLREAAVRRGVLSPADAARKPESELVDLIFDHGFSTRAEVGETAGRGVGLDVVRRRVESLGGGVTVESTVGLGTRFDISVPFTITKEGVLVVDASGVLLGLPARQVLAVLGPEDLPKDLEARTVSFSGERIPLRSLCAVLQLPLDGGETAALVLELSGKRYALRVPQVLGEQQLIRRPADALLVKSSAVGASALLDDGRLVLLLDIGFVREAISGSQGRGVSRLAASESNKQPAVLVVDDSPLIAEMVKEILMSAGLGVQVAGDGLAALQLLRKFEPDLVISDLEMPRMNGFELLEEIRKTNQRLPFIMLTTRGSVEDRQRATALGANAYLLKTSFSNAGMLEVVSRFVRVNA